MCIRDRFLVALLRFFCGERAFPDRFPVFTGVGVGLERRFHQFIQADDVLSLIHILKVADADDFRSFNDGHLRDVHGAAFAYADKGHADLVQLLSLIHILSGLKRTCRILPFLAKATVD